jgi:uncharacterized protein (TIRG00374 family)
MSAGEIEPKESNGRSLMKRISAVPTPLIFVFSVLLAVGLLWQQGSLGDVINAARDANPWLMIGAMLLYMVSLALLAGRWHILIVMIHRSSHAARAAEAFLTSVVINYAAPVGLAVPSRAALTKRALGLSGPETGAVALWEVGADVLVLSLLSLLWVLISGSKALNALDNAVSPLLVLGVIVAGLLFVGIGMVLIRHLKPSLWARIRFEAIQFFRYPRQYPLDAARAMIVTFVYWGMQIAVLWLLLNAVGVDAGPSLTLGLVSVPILVGMLSPVPGGAGVREALMIAMAHVYNVDSGAVLLAALVYRVALFAAIPILYAGVRLWLKLEHEQPIADLHHLADANAGAAVAAPLEENR